MITDIKVKGLKMTENVCHITSVHGRYDIRIFVKECVTLANSGCDVALIVADGRGDELKHKVNIYDIGRPSDRRDRLVNTGKKIYAKVLALNPKIVHFHDPELMFIGLRLAKDGYKVVYDVHEDVPKQILSKHWVPKILRPLLSFAVKQVERYVAKRIAGAVVTTSIIAKRFLTYNKNTVTVCNYPLLNTNDLNLAETPWEKREDTLCYVGSISKTRGIIQLIKSLAVSKLHLKLAGIVSSDLTLDDLEQLDGYNWVDYMGVLPHPQIADLLSKTRVGMVTLLPTPSYVEALPIKLFEYMLAGVPVVASDFDFWREIVLKYNCGILVDPYNVKQIADACKHLIENPEIAAKMGQNGRSAVLAHFNWDEQAKRLVQLYSDLQ